MVDRGYARGRDWWVLAFFAATAVALAFPLNPTKWRTHIPGNQGDALLNLWILRWVGHHIDDGWGAVWDTSMFFPNDNTLAYSESMLPVAVVHRILAFVVRSDVLAFNLIYVATWALAGWITYLLARRLTLHTGASAVAGLVYMLATPRLIRYGFFQLGFAFLIPLVLLLVVMLFDRQRISVGVALGATIALLAISSSYYGLLMLAALAIVLPIMLFWNRESWRPIVVALGAGALAGGLLVAPVVYQYRELQEDPHFARDVEDAGSAHAEDFLRVSPDNYVLSEVPPFETRSRPESATIEQRLFPGFVAVVFAAIGVVALVRSRSKVGRTMIAFGAAALILLLLSFGLYLRSWRVAWDGVWDLPGFESIRAPARFTVFPQLVLALFAAFGVAAALTRVRRPVVRGVVVVLLVGAVYAETATSLQFSRVPDDAASKAVNEELDTLEPGPVAELPMRSIENGAAWPYVEMPRQWLSTIDENERVGGYSGFAPPDFGTLTQTLNTFPSVESLDTLTDLGVRYVVLRMSLPAGIAPIDREFLERDGFGPYTEENAAAIVDALPAGVENRGRFGDAYLLELVP